MDGRNQAISFCKYHLSSVNEGDLKIHKLVLSRDVNLFKQV